MGILTPVFEIFSVKKMGFGRRKFENFIFSKIDHKKFSVILKPIEEKYTPSALCISQTHTHLLNMHYLRQHFKNNKNLN
jgi:hypothetical protein